MASIFVCGDIFHPSGTKWFIGDELAEIICRADYAIGNLEGVELLDGDVPTSSPFQMQGTIYYLHQCGFDMLLLGNNHITDYGCGALRNTLDTIDALGLKRVGAGLSYEESYRPVVQEIRGLKFAFVNVCEAQGEHYVDRHAPYGYAWMGYPDLFAEIERCSKDVDYTIVFVHLGLEHYELPLPEVRDFYHCLCDKGATCVIGGHPHVAQGYEMYGKKLIAYSLGNFYFPRANGKYPNENVSFSLLLDFDRQGVFKVGIVHHSLKQGVVNVERDIPVNLSYLCEILGEGYEERANEMCVEAYKRLCRSLLVEATCGENEEIDVMGQIKNILRRTIFRKKYIVSTTPYRERLLLRLFENESYRYTIIRALKEMTKQI